MSDLLWYRVTCDDAGPQPREWHVEAPGMDEALSMVTGRLRKDWNGPATLTASHTRVLPAVTPRLERLETLAKIVAQEVAKVPDDLRDLRIATAIDALKSDRP